MSGLRILELGHVIRLTCGSNRRARHSCPIPNPLLLSFFLLTLIILQILYVRKVCPYPAPWFFEPEVAPLDKVVLAAAGEEDDARGCVALVVVEVKEEAEGDDADELEEVNVEVVGLRAVGLPEEGG